MSAEKNPLKHVAIIMDGNGRWAKARGKDRLYGHVQGVESVRKAVKAALRNGVEYLTLYAFSTENWGRPQQEVEGLMELFVINSVREAPELNAQGVRMRFLGDIESLSEEVRTSRDYAEQTTAGGDRLTLILAINYSSRWEITRMARQLAREAAQGKLDPDEITPKLVDDHMATAEYPDPDLIIRTSGEYRLSNFMLWQAVYSEFYFTEVLWPDFDEAEFDRALDAYEKRNRRYGGLK